MFNFSYRRVGGLSFLKVGNLSLSWSISNRYKALQQAAPKVRTIRFPQGGSLTVNLVNG
jgi:hypothetical protein